MSRVGPTEPAPASAPAPARERGPILFLHPSDEAYGADRMLLELVEGALADGRRALVLLADDAAPGWLSDQLEARAVPFERVPLAPARRRYATPRRLARYAADLWAARGVVRRRVVGTRAAIIHVNTSALLVGALVGRPGGARLVWHVHEIVPGRSPVALAFRVLPVLAADRVVAISQATADHLRPRWLARRRTRVVANGLPEGIVVPAALGAPKPIVAFVGRLNHWKGYEVFIEAAAAVIRSGAAGTFVLAGGAPPGEAWRADDAHERIARTGAPDRFRLLGDLPAGAPVIAAADIVVVPSTSPEPFGLVALEAMRSGRPVIASAHGGVTELVEDGRTGILVPPRDAAALAGAIESLLADPARRVELGAEGRRRFLTRYTHDRFRGRMGETWSEL